MIGNRVFRRANERLLRWLCRDNLPGFALKRSFALLSSKERNSPIEGDCVSLDMLDLLLIRNSFRKCIFSCSIQSEET